jgi:DNA-binding PadR family transcriptional regulator
MEKHQPLELLPGTMDLLILKTLARGKMHGYGVGQMLKAASGDVLEVGESSLSIPRSSACSTVG